MSETPPPLPTVAGEVPAAPVGIASTAGGRRRLHPATLFAPMLVWLSRVAIPLGVALLAGFGWSLLPMFAVYFVVSVVGHWLRFFTLTYEFVGDELRIREGILEKTQRQIPFDRVQNVRLERHFLHRIFRVADVQIETAGTTGTEAALTLVGDAEAEDLRARLLGEEVSAAGASADAPGAAAEPAIHAVPTSRLFVAGLTSHVMTFVFGLAVALVVFSGWLPFVEQALSQADPLRWIGEVEKHVENRGIVPEPFAFLLQENVLKTLLIVTGGLVVAVVRYVLLWHGFRLRAAGSRLIWEHGLLHRRVGGARRGRVQVLKAEEPLLRRLVGLTTLKVDTAGDQTAESGDHGGRGVLLPVVPTPAVADIVPVVFPGLDPAGLAWRRVSPLAVRRETLKGSLVLALVLSGLVVPLGWKAPVAWAAGCLAIYMVQRLAWRRAGYSLGERYFACRTGWLYRTTRWIPRDRIQLVAVSRSPFDRRLGLASLVIDTAGQTHTGGMPPIRHLPLAEARRLADALVGEGARSDTPAFVEAEPRALRPLA